MFYDRLNLLAVHALEAELSSASLSDDQTREIKDAMYTHMYNSVSIVQLIASYVHWFACVN